jgi:hypothetical protein
MWRSANWDLKWQHALVSVAAGAAIGLVCAHVLEHCGWDGNCPHKYLVAVGFFVGITAFLAGALAFALIAIKFVMAKMWALLRS